MDTVLDGRGALLSEQAVQHLDQCPQCRTLYDWASADSRVASISPTLNRRIVRSLRASPQPVKLLPLREALIAEFIAVFVVLSTVLTALMGTAGIVHASMTQVVVIGVLLLTGVYLFATMLANQMRPGSYQPVSWHVVLAAMGLALLVAMGVLFPWVARPRFVAEGLPCLVSGVGIAIPAAALLWLGVRRGATFSIIAKGGTLGAIAGLVGVTVLQIKCTHQEAAHLLAWHWSVLLIAVGGGVLAGWLAQRVSDRSSNGK
jgi:hypothetical protein